MNNRRLINDHLEFEQTAIPHMDVLRHHALHLTRNSEDANDLVQETYLKAFRSWHSYEKGTNIKGWLYQIMKNSYINLYRKKVKEPRKIEYSDIHFHHTGNPFGELDLRQFDGKSYDNIFEDEVAHSFQSLPLDFKTVLLLSDYEDLSYEEIAHIVDCPIGTVRSRLHRGRRHLQKRLFDYASRNGYIMRDV